MAPRILRLSAVALAVLMAGACGSAPRTSARPAAKHPPRLSLTKAATAGSAADSAMPSAIGIRPVSYVLDGTLPDLGTQAPVYRWTAHTATIAEVNQLAAALGINATATATADGYQVSDGKATLTVSVGYGATQISYYLGGANSSGGSSGSSPGSVGSVGTGSATANANTSGPASPPPSPPVPPPTGKIPEPLPPDTATTLPARVAPVDVPSAPDAETIARDLLTRAGLLAGEQWDAAVNDSGGVAILCTIGAKCTTDPGTVSARDVTFTLSLNGVRAEGISWTVTVGEHSRVESVSGEWGAATVLGSYHLRTTASAFTALQNGDGNFGGVPPVGIDAPVSAQGAPDAAGGPATDPASTTTTDPNANSSTTSVPPDVVHVTGAALGIARWDAVDGNQNVVDLVPTYLFHTTGPDGSTGDVTVLALDPGAIDFAKPIIEPVPGPVPVPSPVPEPSPVPQPGTAVSPSIKPAPAPTTTPTS